MWAIHPIRFVGILWFVSVLLAFLFAEPGTRVGTAVYFAVFTVVVVGVGLSGRTTFWVTLFGSGIIHALGLYLWLIDSYAVMRYPLCVSIVACVLVGIYGWIRFFWFGDSGTNATGVAAEPPAGGAGS